MKETFKTHQREYQKELNKFQKEHHAAMFPSCQKDWEEFMKKVYKACAFTKRNITKINEYTSVYSKKNQKNLPLPLALLDQVVHFYITDEIGKMEIEPLGGEKEVDTTLLNKFFSTMNTVLYEENMPFRWSYNSVNKDKIFWIELARYRTR